jgi:TRAP-type mannitol/chloroaromatic compound transport system substrate-binding protein
VLDAVNRGLIDASHAWPGYWAGKNSAAGLFAPGPGGPFGMDREEYLGWLFAGGGLELYNEMLQKELKMNVVVPVFTTSLPYWEPLGWFKKPFNSLDDLRKMRFRTSGLGMEMMKTMGVSVVTLAGGEVIPALERGAIEGAEWAIPSHDILMGFQNVTKYYYMPDLRQPASYQEVLINKGKWDALPKDLQAIVKWAGMAEIIRMTSYSVDLDSKAVEGAREEARREDRPDAGRRAQGAAPRHRQGLRGRGAEESVLREGAEVAEGVRLTGGAARAEDPPADRRRHRALLEEIGASGSFMNSSRRGKRAPCAVHE